MSSVELILELPVAEGSVDDFPDEDALARTGSVGTSFGLDGQQYLQLGVVVGLASMRLLRAWLIARAERLQGARVTWGDKGFTAYTPKEIDRIMRSLERRLEQGEDESD